MEGMWLVSYVLLWLLMVAMSVLSLGLVRQVGLLHLRRIEASAQASRQSPPGPSGNPDLLKIGALAPHFLARSADGEDVSLDQYRGRPTLFMFSTPACDRCENVLRTVTEKASNILGGRLALVAMTEGTINYALHLSSQLGTDVSVLLDDGEITAAYGVPARPYAVFLDPDGIVRGKGHPDEVLQLLGRADGAELGAGYLASEGSQSWIS